MPELHMLATWHHNCAEQETHKVCEVIAMLSSTPRRLGAPAHQADSHSGAWVTRMTASSGPMRSSATLAKYLGARHAHQ